MAKSVSFEKMTGAGNDFIVVDNRQGELKGPPKARAIAWCDRKNGIGADGVLLLERSKKADLRMRIFNPDGSEADMCGNGVRCLARFAFEHRLAKAEHTIETGAGLIRVQVRREIVKARLTDPKDFRRDVDIVSNGKTERVHFLNTGVPHAVIVEKSLESDIDARARAIRFHETFAPRGTNVNFMRFALGNKIEVRTYERGVEGETLACGTGSTASALVAARLRALRSPVEVKTAGGEVLKVHFKEKNGTFRDVYLEGAVRRIFEGRIAI